MPEIELQIIPLLCNPAYNSIDVGAYTGEYTNIMSQHSRVVYSFEPIPRRYTELIKKRFVKDKNVQIYQVALSDDNQTRYIHIPHFRNRFHKDYALDVMSSIENSIDEYFKGKNKTYLGTERLKVQTRTLDSFDISDIALIKIDVEGHELAVIDGAKKSIEEYLPNLLIEIEERHNHNGHNKVNALLTELGYCGYFIYGGHILPFNEFDIEKMQIMPLEQIKNRPSPNIPGYVNNFVFIHESKDITDLIEQQLRQLQESNSTFPPL